MSNNILFVFEGEKTEDQISSCLERPFFNSDSTSGNGKWQIVYKLSNG